MNRKITVTIGIIISAVFLYFSVRNIDFTQVKQAFATANYFWAIPTGALIIFTMWIRALRWYYLLSGIKRIRRSSLFSSVMIGFMANNVLPVRLGEIVRAFSIAQKEGISRSGSFATILVERIFDSFAILFILAACLILFPFPPAIKKVGYMTFAANIVASIILFSLSRWPVETQNLISKITGIFPVKIHSFVMRLLARFMEGLSIFNEGRDTLIVILYTAALWITTALSNFFIFFAFGIYPPFIAPFVVLVVVALAVMLPSSPGFIGTFQYGCTIALALFSIPKEIAFPFSIVLWSSQYFPVTLLGLYYLRKESFSLKIARDEELV